MCVSTDWNNFFHGETYLFCRCPCPERHGDIPTVECLDRVDLATCLIPISHGLYAITSNILDEKLPGSVVELHARARWATPRAATVEASATASSAAAVWVWRRRLC